MIKDLKKEAIAYWEKRRIIYNLLLAAAAFVGWQISSELTYNIDDSYPASLLDPKVMLAFVVCCLVANVCYSLCYILEFLFISENPIQKWKFPGRAIVFSLGCIIGLILAAEGANNIQIMYAGGALPVVPF